MDTPTVTAVPPARPRPQPAKIGCVAIVLADAPLHLACDRKQRYHGIQCKKGRGIILPAGAWAPDKDLTYRHTASRELQEEMGLIIPPDRLRYVWHGPDGYGYDTFGFKGHSPEGTPIETNEGTQVLATFEDLRDSLYGPWDDVLFREMYERSSRGW